MGDNSSQLPFWFVYGRQSSDALLKVWPSKTESRQLDDSRLEHTRVWSDPKTGLQVRLTAVGDPGSPVYRVDGRESERKSAFKNTYDVVKAVM